MAWASRLLVVAACALHCGAVYAQTATAAPDFVTAGDWGGVGLLQTHTARFEADGQFNIGYSFANPYKRYAFSLTYFPWLEATFRYTEVRTVLYSIIPGFSGDQRYKDRGADLKFRLLSEGRYRPAIAVGFQDLLGTGLFAGEYFVASKRLGDLDFSAGIGWGTIGGAGQISNPFLLISDRFSVREGAEGLGGQVAVLSLFGGERAGVFGGVEYRSPLEGLSFKIEYDANAYASTAILTPPTSPINYGLVFRPYDWFEFSFGRERGNTTLLRFTLRMSLNAVAGVPKIDPAPPPIGPRLPIAAFTPTYEAPPEPPIVAPPAQTPAPAPVLVPAPAPAPAPAALLTTPRAFDVPPALAARSGEGTGPFEALAAHGATVERFATIGDEAYIDILGTSGAVPLGPIATDVLRALPSDVQALTLRDLTIGGAAGQVRVARDAGDAADALYTMMADRGWAVEDVAFRGEDVVIVASPRGRDGADLGAAAAAAARALPGQTSVTVQATGGVVATWTRAGGAVVSSQSAANASRSLAVAGQETSFAPVVEPFTPGQRQVIAERLNDGLRAQGFVLEYVEVEPRNVVVGVYAYRYREFARNVGLAARAVANALPASVEVVTIAFLNAGVELSRLTFLRQDLEWAASEGGPEDFWLRSDLEPGQPWWPGEPVPWRYPRFQWSLGPQVRQHIGGPDRFYLYQAWLSLGASLDITRGLSVSGQVGKSLYSGFDRIRLASDSGLPRVRSDIKEYLQQGADNVVRLQTTYIFKPAEDLYARVSAGLLEEMYGGISGEVLFRPFESRLALGVEISRVRQREFDQRFEFRDYKVTTGHVSLYYDTPFSGVVAVAHMGTYLAGDRGVTLELSRRFNSGVRVGAWATFTNVSPAQFGEGSFDKGFYMVIPFDLFLTRSSTASGVFGFRPLTRDGGQRLGLAGRLYDITSQANLGAISRDWPLVMK